MVRPALAFVVIAIGGTIGQSLHGGGTRTERSVLLDDTCQAIASAVSNNSDVYDFLSLQYLEDISHWGGSSTEYAACSFEPGTPEDVGIALNILAKTQTPFAVKGGGHTANLGFSSTRGVQIAMSRFSDVVYDHATQTVRFGAGLIWDDVYKALEKYQVNVVGGRVSGVGVGGFILGGGYSWLTNQHGLTVDTVQAYELVMPNGTVTNVTEASSPDLFFALKGGGNNFGIVTRFTLKTFPQTQIWGGVLYYPATLMDEINQATENFAVNTMDPKAEIIVSYNYPLGLPQPAVLFFYDAPTPPPGIFGEFLAIPRLIGDVSTRSFLDFVQSIPLPPPRRIAFNSFSVSSYTRSFLEQIVQEANYWSASLLDSVTFINYDVEPFLPDLLDHSTSPSAYPPDRSRRLMPLEIYFAWELPEFDQVVQDAIRTTVQRLEAHAFASGLSDANAAVYPNYVISNTPLEKMYGANVPRLKAIKRAVDPDGVMDLAGGWKFI